MRDFTYESAIEDGPLCPRPVLLRCFLYRDVHGLRNTRLRRALTVVWLVNLLCYKQWWWKLMHDQCGDREATSYDLKLMTPQVQAIKTHSFCDLDLALWWLMAHFVPRTCLMCLNSIFDCAFSVLSEKHLSSKSGDCHWSSLVCIGSLYNDTAIRRICTQWISRCYAYWSW